MPTKKNQISITKSKSQKNNLQEKSLKINVEEIANNLSKKYNECKKSFVSKSIQKSNGALFATNKI